jgi:ParB-like chromosome segregation protein Spo0J
VAEAEWVDINAIKPWDKNPRKNAAAIKEVAGSIKRFGFSSPIIVRRADNVIIAGHTRWAAAQSLGLDKVLVRFMDLDPAQAKALALADNKLGELAEWDAPMLAEILRGLNDEDVALEGLGFDAQELETMLQEMPDIDLDDLDDSVTPGQESEFAGLRMQIRKEDRQEVEDAAASDWGDPEAPGPQAQRIGALFLHLWRTYGNR